ncbi:MAG: phosphotransferase [Aeromicrobium erythreum]
MPQGFPALVTSAAWRHEAESWIHDRAQDAGRRLAGPVEQLRVRPWSTQLVVATDQGRWWFKANCASMRFEAGLHDLLARLVPESVAAPVAVDVERGWILTDDKGPTLGDSRTPTLEDWCDVVRTTARMQRRLAAHEQAVLATGVPDCRPESVPERMDRVVEQLGALPADHPSHLDEASRRALEARRPAVVDAAQALAESPVPVTFQHGDVHPWNTWLDLRVLDFGDVQWGSALEVLQVPYGWIARESTLPWEPVRDAYVEEWSDLVDHRTLHALLEASVFTHAVNRTTTWIDALRDAAPDELAQWGDGARRTLGRVLEA